MGECLLCMIKVKFKYVFKQSMLHSTIVFRALSFGTEVMLTIEFKH